jgi:hypothetical protein
MRAEQSHLRAQTSCQCATLPRAEAFQERRLSSLLRLDLLVVGVGEVRAGLRRLREVLNMIEELEHKDDELGREAWTTCSAAQRRHAQRHLLSGPPPRGTALSRGVCPPLELGSGVLVAPGSVLPVRSIS